MSLASLSGVGLATRSAGVTTYPIRRSLATSRMALMELPPHRKKLESDSIATVDSTAPNSCCRVAVNGSLETVRAGRSAGPAAESSRAAMAARSALALTVAGSTSVRTILPGTTHEATRPTRSERTASAVAEPV